LFNPYPIVKEFKKRNTSLGGRLSKGGKKVSDNYEKELNNFTED